MDLDLRTGLKANDALGSWSFHIDPEWDPKHFGTKANVAC